MSPFANVAFGDLSEMVTSGVITLARTPALFTLGFVQRYARADLNIAVSDYILCRPAITSSEKSFTRIAFAGCLETLSWQESALERKIHLSERSELWIFLSVFSRFLQT